MPYDVKCLLEVNKDMVEIFLVYFFADDSKFTASPPACINSAGMLSTPDDFPFFKDLNAASTSPRRIGKLISSMFIGQSNTAAFPLVWLLKDSEQYSVHRLIISLSSVMHFSDLSWMVFILPFFSLVTSFINRNALSLFFLFRLSSISLHCSFIHLSLASFVHVLILLLISLYLLVPPGLFFPLFSTLLLSHMSSSSVVTRVSSFDGVCRGSHWLYQSLHC